MKGKLTNLQTHEALELPSVAMIGRSSECNIVIADQRASRRHAMIRKQEDGFWLFDLGSFNGSYINGARVTAARQLNDGDILNFADHEFRYNQSGSVTQDIQADLGGSTIALIRSKPVIMLVSDIEGFTPLSEKLSPDDLAQVIGSWYSDCDMILRRHGATVDKFIGDCVLAYWTEVNERTLTGSVLAAKELLGSCDKIREERKEVFDKAHQDFSAGVAIHTGEVAYGGMGQGEFTLVGDPVNLTFRIESLTRELDHNVLASEQVVNAAPALKNFSENLGKHQVKGKADPIEIWGFHSFPE